MEFYHRDARSFFTEIRGVSLSNGGVSRHAQCYTVKIPPGTAIHRVLFVYLCVIALYISVKYIMGFFRPALWKIFNHIIYSSYTTRITVL
jgi:hypothetical protein